MGNYVNLQLIPGNEYAAPQQNQVMVLDDVYGAGATATPVTINPVTGAMSGNILDVVTVSTNTYTLNDNNVGQQIYFTYAGAVTVTLAGAASLNVGDLWMWAAGPSTTLTFSKATGGDTLLGATTAAATESGTIILRSGTIFENDPRFQVAGPGAGDVVGPSSATDNAICRYDGTTGKLIQNSLVIIDDSGNVSGLVGLTVTGNIAASTATVGSDVTALINNTDNTNAASGAQLQLVVGGASAGDPSIKFLVTGGSGYILGVDNSNSDMYTLSAGSSLGTSNILTITTGGDAVISGSILSGTTITATTTLTATLGAITATNGNFVNSTSGTGRVVPVVTASGVASGAVTANGRMVQVTFTSVSIAAGATLALQIDNSAITNSSTLVNWGWAGATTSSALCPQSAVTGTGTFTLTLTNGTGAATSTADVVVWVEVLAG